MSERLVKSYPRRAVLPVIHLQSEHQAIEMAGIAKEAGAGGVFIIDHKPSTSHDPEILAQAVTDTMIAHPDLWVGVNCLSRHPEFSYKLFAEALGVDGVWTDNATGWSHGQKTNKSNLEAAAIYCEATDCLWKNLDTVYFGGLAMKGAGYIEDPYEAAAFVEATQHYVDVVTTSGPETGHASPLERIIQIRLAIDVGGKLAVASGVNVNNIAEQASLVDYFLVASSIETEPMSGIFDKWKLLQLIQTLDGAMDRELHAMHVEDEGLKRAS